MSGGAMAWDGIGWETVYHGVLEFESAFARHYVADGGDCADLDSEGDTLGDGC